ncbi:MAG: ArdC family protein [Phycisphaerales bacterium]
MNADDAKKIADNALKALTEELGRGRSETLTRYLATLARFHRYSFGNVMLIAVQRPDATRVAGFHAWRQLGRHVKKGEKGIVIIAPMLIKPKQAPERTDADEARPDRVLRFRGVYVFDVAQTDGEPLAEHAQVSGDPSGCLDRLKASVASRDIALTYADLSPGHEGYSQGGSITIRKGLAPAVEFAVMVHELAHELLHHGAQRPDSKAVVETEAEAVAYVVCTAVGLDTGTASSDYIQLYRGDADTLGASLDRIQRTAADIIAAITSDTAAAAAAAA